MLLFIMLLTRAFSLVGRAQKAEQSEDRRFVLWVLGSALFAHAVTMMSVSYFDQSVFFLYFNLAIVSSLGSESLTLPSAARPSAGPVRASYSATAVRQARSVRSVPGVAAASLARRPLMGE